MTDTRDPLDRVADLRPSDAWWQQHWNERRRDDVLTGVLSGREVVRPVYVARRRWRVAAPVAASVAIVGAVVATAALTGGGGGAGHPPLARTSSTATIPTTVTATPRVGTDQWSYRAYTYYAYGKDAVTYHYATWTAPSGDMWMRRDDRNDPACRLWTQDSASFSTPDQAFFDAMPTDPAALKAWLESHADGSTSREEALFVAAGDALRGGDGLATAQLRHAWVQVLAGLGRVSTQTDTDKLGRPALRLDFVDPQQRPGSVASLYFDPATFQLLEERSSPLSTAPAPGPSAAYTSVPSGHPVVPGDLAAPDSVSVMTEERVVDSVPANCGL